MDKNRKQLSQKSMLPPKPGWSLQGVLQNNSNHYKNAQKSFSDIQLDLLRRGRAVPIADCCLGADSLPAGLSLAQRGMSKGRQGIGFGEAQSNLCSLAGGDGIRAVICCPLGKPVKFRLYKEWGNCKGAWPGSQAKSCSLVKHPHSPCPKLCVPHSGTPNWEAGGEESGREP